VIIDADAIARRMNPADPEKANMAAGRETIRLVNDAIATGKNFTIETTFGGGNALRQMNAAKQQGFHINLYYIGLDSVDLHIDRVAQRVSKGGHHIPEDLIHQRYKTSHENLPKAMRLADNTYLFDNTEVYAIKAEVQRGHIRFQAPESPEWVQKAIKSWGDHEQKLYLQDLMEERDKLTTILENTNIELRSVKHELEPLQALGKLKRDRDLQMAKLEELKPKNLIQKIKNPHHHDIQKIRANLIVVEKNIASLESKITIEIRTIFMELSTSRIQRYYFIKFGFCTYVCKSILSVILD